MTSRKRKLSDDEIEAEVLADLADPTAWEDPIYVPPSTSARPEWVVLGRHLELSARFHVLSVLHRLGAEANLTHAHPSDVDITVVHAPGRALTIDVKTLIGTPKWFVQPFSARKNHYIAFVLFSRKAAHDPSVSPDVLVFSSDQLKAVLANHQAAQVNVQAIADELDLGDPWQQLVVAAA